MLGMQGTTQVPLDAVQPVAGVDYSITKPRWWILASKRLRPQDEPP
jgi:hypothetical protein